MAIIYTQESINWSLNLSSSERGFINTSTGTFYSEGHQTSSGTTNYGGLTQGCYSEYDYGHTDINQTGVAYFNLSNEQKTIYNPNNLTLSSATLTCTFSNSGNNATKRIGARFCYPQANSSYINLFPTIRTTGSAAYNTTITLGTWNSSTDLGYILNGLKSVYSTNQNQIVITFFLPGETVKAGQKYSTNYCRITNCILTLQGVQTVQTETADSVIYVHNGSSWKPATVYVHNGSAWKQGSVKYHNGSWK